MKKAIDWLKLVYMADDKGKMYPRCGGTNTNKKNGIGYCYDCEKESC